MPEAMPLMFSRYASVSLPARFFAAACAMGMTMGRTKPATPPKLTLKAANTRRKMP